MSDDICKVNVSLSEVEGEPRDQVVVCKRGTGSVEKKGIITMLDFMRLPPERAAAIVKGSTQKFYETCKTLRQHMYASAHVLYPQLISEARSMCWLSNFVLTMFPADSEPEKQYVPSRLEKNVTVMVMQRIDHLHRICRYKYLSWTYWCVEEKFHEFSIKYRGLVFLSRSLHNFTDDDQIVRASLYALMLVFGDVRIRDAVGDYTLSAFIKCIQVHSDDERVLNRLFNAAVILTGNSKHVHNFEWARVLIHFIYEYMIKHEHDEYRNFQYPLQLLCHFASDPRALEEILSLNFVGVVGRIMDNYTEFYDVLLDGAKFFYSMTLEGDTPELQSILRRCRNQIRETHGSLNFLQEILKLSDAESAHRKMAEHILEVCKPESQE